MGEGRSWMAAIFLAGCLATWLTFSRLQDLQHADTLILALVSLQRWTPFLWESDRFGMLAPLIAKPVQDPFSNLLLQTAIDVAAALLAPFLLARFLMRDSRWFSAGATANLLLLVTGTAAARFDWLVAQPYAMSTSLGLASLLTLETAGRPRLFAAAVLMLLAHWVNVGIGIMLVPLVLLGGRSRWRVALLIGASTLSVSLFARALPLPRTPTAVISISGWPHAWSLLLQMAVAATVPARRAAAGLGILVAVAAALLSGGARRLRESLRPAGIAIGAAVSYWIAIGTLEWVRLNLYFPRYMFPALLLIGVALAILIVSAFDVPQRIVRLAASAALITATFAAYGSPSAASVRRSLDEKFGGMTPEILKSGATVIAGDYWTVWPSVFHANLRSQRETRHTEIYGLTYRSAVTDDLWDSRTSEVLIAAAPGDPSVSRFANRIQLPLTLIERRPTVDLFTAARH